MKSEDREHAKANFEKRAGDYIEILMDGVKSNMEIIQAVGSLFDSSETVTRQEFRVFVKRFLSRHPGIQALEWIPRVRDSERAAYEEAARREGLAGFQITERQEQGDMARDRQRTEYYPVYYVEPFKGNESAAGFNLASNAVRLKSLEKARDTNALVASGRITLVQETGRQSGILVFMPVYRRGAPRDTTAERRESLTGFAVGVFRIGDMAEHSLLGLDLTDVDLHIYDDSADAESRFLFFSVYL